MFTKMWKDLIPECHNGFFRQSRVGGCWELFGKMLVLSEPRYNVLRCHRRNISPIYAAAETLWYLSGQANVDMLAHYAPKYRQFAESDGNAFGAYGYRWMNDPGFAEVRTHLGDDALDQIQAVTALLREQPNTRQAVINMWNGGDLLNALRAKRKDLPCTLAIQFLIQENRLCAITMMRSNDIWLGTPYDVFAFTTLQRLIANELELKLGEYRHVVGSMHLYASNLEAAIQATGSPEEDPLNFDFPPEIYPENLTKSIIAAVRAEERWRQEQILDLPMLYSYCGDVLADLVVLCALHKNHDEMLLKSLKNPVLRHRYVCWKVITDRKRLDATSSPVGSPSE